MSTERIKMKKIRELLRLKYEAKLTHRQIGRALNISPGTVSYYSQAANQAGLSWPLAPKLSDDELIQLLEPLAKQLRAPQAQYVKPEFSEIKKALSKKHMTLMLLWEDYKTLYQDQAYSYAQFTRHYKAWAKTQKVSMRLEHVAGEKGFIDYAGTTIPIYCRDTGKKLMDAQLFVMALGLSHYTFAYASQSQKLPDWVDAHRRAFEFYGGVPKILVPDNLKSGITDSCQFEPEANPTYADMSEHYKTAIIPARPRSPQDKSIAENAVLVASRWILARLLKQKFYSLPALNNAISELLVALNNKPFQKRQGSRHQQFVELEKPYLIELPDKPYETATLKYQTVPPDYHVRIDGHYYSVPYIHINEEVLCRYTQRTVEVFKGNTRIASHARSFEKDKKTTIGSHMPKAHQNYRQWTPQVFIDWADNIGHGALNVALSIVANKKHPEQCSKIHFGLKKLHKRFGGERLNQACRRALVLNCVNFKSIQSILEKGLDKSPHVELVPSLNADNHTNLRGSNYYKQPQETK